MRIIWSFLVSVSILGAVVARNAADKLDTVYVEYGQNLGQTVPARINSLLQRAGVTVNNYDASSGDLPSGSLVLSFGNSTMSKDYVSLIGVKSEGFRIVAKPLGTDSNVIASNGKPIDPSGKSFAMDLDRVHYGAVVGAYAVLEQLGFSFLHPMEPLIPSLIALPTSDISTTESPYWPTRTWHIHTQHPLEFTEVLNGFDIPMFAKTTEEGGEQATAGAVAAHSCLPGQYCETWESMFSTLDGLFEWLAANRQNRVEVLLLGSPKWDVYNNLTSGEMRQQRLRRINTLSHEYGVLIGADIPIANRQQHGWKMISLQDSFEQQTQSINDRVDWAFAADYDFISTESGLSEFTKPSCDLMLSLFNIFTERGELPATLFYARGVFFLHLSDLYCLPICALLWVFMLHAVSGHWNREAVTKVHCSTSQFCDEKVSLREGGCALIIHSSLCSLGRVAKYQEHVSCPALCLYHIFTMFFLLCFPHPVMPGRGGQLEVPGPSHGRPHQLQLPAHLRGRGPGRHATHRAGRVAKGC
jgi:hypothetical protein